MLPNVNVTFENGNLGTVATNPDGVCGLVSSAVAAGDFELGKHYIIYSLKDAEDLGILNTVGNHELHKTISEFYDEAGTGTELWIYGVLNTTSYANLVDASKALLTASNRRLSAIIVKYAPAVADADVADGLFDGFPGICTDAQKIADDFTNDNLQPVVFILEAYNYQGVPADLLGFGEATYNRVLVMIGDTETRAGEYASKGAAVGVLAGRLARNQVHVNIGRVKDGALKPLQFYIVDTPAELVNVTPLHDKGFVTLRTHIGKSGFYFTDDLMACTVEDDYHYLARRRTIDKAFRLANGTLTNYLLDDLNVTSEGKISPIVAKGIEAEIERVINQEMSANGELSVDVTKTNDTGVEAIVDLNEVVARTSKIKGQIKVRPKGYGRFISFSLGFNINANAN